jgi:muramoyltetrapeptide carboxypeptidase
MLKRRYTIGVIAPSLPSAGKREQKVRAAIAYLEQEGHTVLVSDGTYEVIGYKSSGARERAAALSAFLKDPRVDMIIATTGGYNSNEILDFIDLSSFVPTEKVFVGYSDCTVLSMALQRFNVCRTVCGPMLVDYVDYPECFEKLFSALESSSLELTNEAESWESIESGRFPMVPMQSLPNKGSSGAGSAIAANLSTLCLMMGTPYLPSFSGRILFLEYDREEQTALPSLERLMWQLRQCGVLKNLSGLVFGALQPSVVAEETATDSIERILTEVTSGYEYPVIYNAQFGHIYPSWVIENGREVRVSEDRLEIFQKR